MNARVETRRRPARERCLAHGGETERNLVLQQLVRTLKGGPLKKLPAGGDKAAVEHLAATLLLHGPNLKLQRETSRGWKVFVNS